MDVNSLTLLVDILDAGNLSEAARRLKMSRANVSYHLNQLERSIGLQLVRRTTRRVEATEIGLQLYEHGRTIQNALLAARGLADHKGAPDTFDAAGDAMERYEVLIDLGRELPPLPEGAKGERRPDGTLALSYAPGRMQADQIVDRLRAAGVPMLDLQTEQPDLEDVFLQLTGSAAG